MFKGFFLTTTLIWFRRDLRLHDHAALNAACEMGHFIIPLFIYQNNSLAQGGFGAAQKWWLYHSLKNLQGQFKDLGLQFIFKQGKAIDVLSKLFDETNATGLYWNRSYDPYTLSQDEKIKNHFETHHKDIKDFPGSVLFEPWTIQNKQNKPYKVFNQYWKTCLKAFPIKAPLPAPKKMKAYSKIINSDHLSQWNLIPKNPDWSHGFNVNWQPGETNALQTVEEFILGHHIQKYKYDRQYPSYNGSSNLSPCLHFGEISPRQIWQKVRVLTEMSTSTEKFLTEIGWREFSYYLLYHFPKFHYESFRADFKLFVWDNSQERLLAWQKGKTGYPLVDAGMRQLWQIGWMHNRVRMVVASFLTKHLLIEWQKGAAWFLDTLLDADLANNSMGWQWIAGTGVDAAPYFRIFNPILQGEKFDPQGNYIRKWVPELEHVPKKYIHQPWTASEDILKASNVKLGENYPFPIVDHSSAYKLALQRYKEIKSMKDIFKDSEEEKD